MAKKKKNTKPAKSSGAEKKSASQKKSGSKKSSPSQKKTSKSKKPELKKSKSPKKKTPLKKLKKGKGKEKSKKESVGGGGSKPKKGAGFSSNNFNYIRSLIWREYGLDYVSYFDPKFINIVRATYNECKAAGQECSDREILIFYDDILQNPKRDYPYIDEDLYTDAFPYYQLLDVKFDVFPAYLWVFSPMIMPPPSEFIITSYVNNKDGSANKGYRKYFKEFVDWCNEAMRNLYGSEVNSDDIDIFVKFSQPEYIESKERWETEIIICDSEGNPESFGFEPKGRMTEHDVEDEFEIPKEEEKIHEEEGIKTIEQISPDEEKRLKENNEKLFSLLLNMKKKQQQLEKKEKTKIKKKIEVKRKKVDVQVNKQKELNRLKQIKKEFEKSIMLYKKIGDKKRMNKSLKDLDVIIRKIKKLS